MRSQHEPLSRLRVGVATAVLALALPGSGLTAANGAEAATPAASVHLVDPKPYRTYKQEHYDAYAFSSPSGGIRCSIAQYEDSSPWGCYVVRHTWKDPKLPNWFGPCVKRLKGAMFTPWLRGGFHTSCDGDYPGITKRSRSLKRGSTIRVHGVSCTSIRIHGAEAMTCSIPKGAALTVSRTMLRFNQPKR